MVLRISVAWTALRCSSAFVNASLRKSRKRDHSPTYADGAAASVFGQYPPLVNASRKPGQWQTYDIIFHRARFNPDGSLLCAARVTVIQNGILVQNDAVLTGPTAYKRRPPYDPKMSDTMPLLLQDHGHPVRYRDIWVRPLADSTR